MDMNDVMRNATAILTAVAWKAAGAFVKQQLKSIPNALATPAPEVDVLQFTPAGPLLCVRPYCNNQHYWQVYFDANRLIRETFGEARFPAPMPGYTVTGNWAAPPSDTLPN